MSSTSSINSLLSSSSLSANNSALNLSSILTSITGSSSTGIDVNAAVSAALYAARAPERVWQGDQTTLNSQATALGQIQTATQTLNSDLQNLNSLIGPLSARIVSSSNSNYVTATAANGTVAGVHSMVVNNLATKGSWYSDLETSPTATLPSSSMTITMTGGQTATFNTGSGQTGDNLNDLATAINGASLGVTATVVSDSTGSRLAIVSNSTGKSADFSITSPNYSGTSWSSATIPAGSTLGANSVTIGQASASITVTSTSGETYAQFATDINNAITSYNSTATANGQATLNVTAAAGSNSSGTYLSVTSNDGTTPFTINEPSFGFTQASAALDASVTLDGVPLQSATNTLTSAIPGVTVNLLGSTQGSTVNLTIASDASSVSTAINQFVTDYNSAINLVNSQFKVTSSTDSSGNTTSSQGPLGAESTMRNLQSALEQALTYSYTPSSGTTTVSSLADLGIALNNDGTLSVNSATLNNTLVNHASDVQNFLEGSALNGFASNFSNVLNNYINPGNGAFQVELQSISTQNSNLTQQISDFESGYIAGQRVTLNDEYSKAEEALQTMQQTMQQMNALLGFNKSNG